MGQFWKTNNYVNGIVLRLTPQKKNQINIANLGRDHSKNLSKNKWNV